VIETPLENVWNFMKNKYKKNHHPHHCPEGGDQGAVGPRHLPGVNEEAIRQLA
jgi:hypothetical protein